jgi:hypothetical protein
MYSSRNYIKEFSLYFTDYNNFFLRKFMNNHVNKNLSSLAKDLTDSGSLTMTFDVESYQTVN